MRNFLLLMALVGGLLPWGFFALYFSQHGLSVSHMVASLFPNPLAGGFTVDILLSIVVFLVWTYIDLRHDRRKWLVILLSSLCVGLSLSLPLYLLIKLSQAKPVSPTASGP